MSVPESRRGLSGVQFIDTAFTLHMFSIQESSNFSKSYTFTLRNPICEAAFQVFRCAKMANSIRVTDRKSYDQRRMYLQKAYAELQVLMSLVDEAYNMGQIKGDGVVKQWSRLMKNEEKYLNAVRKSEEQRYKEERKIEEIDIHARLMKALCDRMGKIITLLAQRNEEAEEKVTEENEVKT